MTKGNRLAILCTMALAVGSLLRPPAAAQTPPSSAPPAPIETFRFELDWPDHPQGSWIIFLRSDGTGLYWPTPTSKFGEQPIRINASTWKRVRAGVPAIQENRCETKAKNIAKTGSKDVDYQDGATPPPTATCTFNFSDDAALNDATATIEAVVATLQLGERLQHDLRFDRLGLDADIDSLIDDLQAGRALEVQNIAPTLKSIADDERVMDRVRRKASRLLPAPEPK